MITGQVNVALQVVLPASGVQDNAVQAAAVTDAPQHANGSFAGLLGGIRLHAKHDGPSDAGRAEPAQNRGSENQGVAEGAAVDLMMQLSVSPRLSAASEPDAQAVTDTEKGDRTVEAASAGSEPVDVAAQLILAAYSQSGRTPGVNIPPQLPVDRLQNVATVTELPVAMQKQAQAATVKIMADETRAVTTAAVPAEQPVAPMPATPTGTAASAGAVRLAADLVSEVNIPSPQPVVTAVAAALQRTDQEPVLTGKLVAASAAGKQHPETAGNAADGGYTAPTAGVSLAATKAAETQASMVVQDGTVAVHSDVTVSTPEVRISAPLPVDGLQNAAAGAEPPVTADSAASNQPEAVIASSRNSQPAATVATTVTVKAETSAVPEAVVTTTAVPAAAQPVVRASQEFELEVQLSQAQPIAVRLAASAGAGDNRAAAVVQETRTARQQSNSDRQSEKTAADNEERVVKNMTSIHKAVLSGASMADSDSSQGGDLGQSQSEGHADNLSLAQNMRGQVSLEHQNVSAPSSKTLPTEPVRQDMPEQIMRQVKERLVQHDIKPGSQQITLTLSPDSLGELKMNLNLQGQKLSVEIVTENKGVRDAIAQHTDSLKESLARQNITMESFDVTTGGKGSAHQGQNQNAWRELAKQQQQQQFWTSPRSYVTAQADVSLASAPYQKQQGHSMLDIHY